MASDTMIIVAGLEAVALVLVVALFLWRQAQVDDRYERLEQKSVAERRELLNRIQRPEVMPAAPAEAFHVPVEEPDEFDLVGQIVPGADE